MRLAIMQPYLFPYIGYFQLMYAVDRFVIYDDVTYIKQGWINRNRIMVNGDPHMFTLPLRNAGSNTLIHEIAVGGVEYAKWRDKFLRTLIQAYSKAPFRQEVITMVEHVLPAVDTMLIEILLKSFTEVLNRLNIQLDMVRSARKYANSHLAATDRVIDICQQEEAGTYINSVGGKELYDKNTFANHGLELKFLRSRPLAFQNVYTQLQGMSIIDLMMWNDPQWIKEQLKAYDLD